MVDNMDKVFYTAGDVVQIKHPLPNKPVMLVKGKETKTIRADQVSHFLGIKCFWFTTNGEYQENIFSTKDLEHYRHPSKEVDVYSREYTKLKSTPEMNTFEWEEVTEKSKEDK
jgi:hypothetical protein